MWADSVYLHSDQHWQSHSYDNTKSRTCVPLHNSCSANAQLLTLLIGDCLSLVKLLSMTATSLFNPKKWYIVVAMTSALAVLKRGFLSFIFLFPLASHLHCLFGAREREGKNGAIVQMKEKKNNSQPSSFFNQLPSLLLQRKHLVPSVPPEKRGKKERSESLHPKCQWGQRGCQLPRTTRCWKTASLNEGCAFRKPSWWRNWLLLPKMAVLAWGKLHRCLYQTSLPRYCDWF